MSFLSQIIICITFKHFHKISLKLYILFLGNKPPLCSSPSVLAFASKKYFYHFFNNRADLNSFPIGYRLLLIKALEVKGPIFIIFRMERSWVIQFTITTEHSRYEQGLFLSKILRSVH